MLVILPYIVHNQIPTCDWYMYVCVSMIEFGDNISKPLLKAYSDRKHMWLCIIAHRLKMVRNTRNSNRAGPSEPAPDG